MITEVLPVLNDLIIDEPVVEKVNFIVPLIAVAAVSAIAIGLIFRKKINKK